MIKVTVLIFLAHFVIFTSAMKLPPYFKPCRRSDPDINECVRSHAQEAVHNLTKGDRKYNIPILQPMTITQLLIQQNDLTLTFDNMKIFGLQDGEIQAARINLENQHEEYDLFFPHLEILSNYTAKGKILIMPVRGDSTCNISLQGVKITFTHDYKLVPDKNGRDHMNVIESSLSFEPKKAQFYFRDILGDKAMSNTINLFLNQNWREILNDVGPYVKEALGQVATQIFNGITLLVPYDLMYPETL